MIDASHSSFHRSRHLSPWVRFGLPALGLFLLWILYRGMPLLFTSLMFSWGLFYILNPLVEFLESHSIRRGVAGALVLLGLVVVIYMMWLKLVDVSVDLRTKIDLAVFQKNLIARAHSMVVWAEEQAPLIKRFIEPDLLPEAERAETLKTSRKRDGSRPSESQKAAPPKAKSLLERIEETVDAKIKIYAPGLALEGAMLAWNFILVLILTFYFTFFFLKDGRDFRKMIIQWVPNRYFEPSLKFFYEMDRRMRSYLLSMLLDCTLVGLLVGIGSALVGTPYPVAFGLIAFVLNTIPLVGPLLYGTICVIITIGSGKPTEVILGFIGVFALSRLCDDLIFAPTIYGKTHHMHPVMIITAVLLGEHFAGAWGMFLAIPIVSTILLGLKIAREISEGEDMTPLPPSVFTPFA